jgi:hypothetical protein
MLTAAAIFIAVVFHYAFVTVFRFSLKGVLSVLAGCFALVVGWEIFLIVRFLL